MLRANPNTRPKFEDIQYSCSGWMKRDYCIRIAKPEKPLPILQTNR